MEKYEIVPFDHNGQNIRMIKDEAGEPWWVLTDVAKALGFAYTLNARRHLRDRHLMTISKTDKSKNLFRNSGRGGAQFLTLINEYGVIRLALRSRLPEAEAFQEQVEALLVGLRRGTIEAYVIEVEYLKDLCKVEQEHSEHLEIELEDYRLEERRSQSG